MPNGGVPLNMLSKSGQVAINCHGAKIRIFDALSWDEPESRQPLAVLDAEEATALVGFVSHWIGARLEAGRLYSNRPNIEYDF